jgi:hypothetical protein
MAEEVIFELSVLFGESGANPNRGASKRDIEVQRRVARSDRNDRMYI